MRGMRGVLKRVLREFLATCGMRGVIKRVLKESFSNMSAPMISRENARCAFLSISSLLAMIKTIPVLKTPFKGSFRLCVACVEC